MGAARRLSTAGMAILCAACTDAGVGPDTRTATVQLRPSFAVQSHRVAGGAALPINRIRLRAVAVPTGAVLDSLVMNVSPEQSEWRLDFDVTVPTPAVPVLVTIELLHASAGGVSVEWSGQAGPFSLAPGATTTPAVTVHRGPIENLALTDVRIGNAPTRMLEGDSTRLTAVVEGIGAGGARVFWASLDDAVATIDTTGLVLGMAPGTARLVAVAGEHADTAAIQVGARPAAITLTPTSVMLEQLGAETQLQARVEDARGSELTDVVIEWLVDGAAVTHLGDGRFRAVANGTAGITARVADLPDLSVNGSITVTQRVVRVVISGGAALLEARGQTTRFTATAEDAGGVAISGADVTWSSSVATVASIATDGTVTAHENGVTEITATIAGISTRTELRVQRVPRRITAHAGDAQRGTVGGALPVAVAVQVSDANGFGIRDLSVGFAADDGASVSNAAATTNGDGIAAVTWTLGSRAGTYTLTATEPSAGSIAFTATAAADGPATLAVAAGNGQTAPAGSAVADAPAVRVTDRFGNAIAGITVQFRIDTGAGSLGATSAVTNADGIASSVSWVLGPRSGTQTVSAEVGTLPAVTFTATAAAGAAAAIRVHAGNDQIGIVGSVLPTAPAVIVVDEHDNPVAGVAVTFAVTAGGGSVSTGSALTDADGSANAGSWTLGHTVGTNTVSATAASLPGVAFDAQATAGPAAHIVIVSGDAQTGTVGTTLTPPVVAVTDALGNPLAGVTVTFAVKSGGGAVTGATPQTDALGRAAPTSWTLGNEPGENTLTATAASLPALIITATAIDACAAAAHAPGTSTSGTFTSADCVILDVPSDNYSFQLSAVTELTVDVGPAGRAYRYELYRDGTFLFANSGSSTESLVVQQILTAGDYLLRVQPVDAQPTGSYTLTTTLGDVAGAVPWLMVRGIALDRSLAATDWTIDGRRMDLYTMRIDDGETVRFSATSTLPLRIELYLSNTLIAASGDVATTSHLLFTGLPQGQPYQVRVMADNDEATGTYHWSASAAAPPASLAVHDGDAQTGSAGMALAVQPAVIVRDAAENALAGVTVSFAVQTGGGTVAHAQAVTQADGVARAGDWTLGTVAGANTMSAAIADLPPVTFNATGQAGPPAALVFTQQPPAVAAGAPFATELELRDAFNNLVAQDSTTTVTVAIAAGTGTDGAVLVGTLTRAVSGGRVRFDSLTVSGGTAQYRLSATAGTLAPVSSDEFHVNAASSVVTWVNATGGSWHTASNWSTGAVPAAADSVRIDIGGTYSITVSDSVVIAHLAVGAAAAAPSLSVQRPLTAQLGIDVHAGAAINVVATLHSPALLTNGGTLRLNGGSAALSIENGGLIEVSGGATGSVSGTLDNSAGIVRVNGNNGNSTLNVLTLLNSATIELTGSSWAGVINAADSIVNTSTGIIHATAGADGHALTGRVQNRGAISADRNLFISNGGLTFDTRGGTILVAAGKALSVTNGTVRIDAASQFSGAGALALNGSITLDLDGDVLLPAGSLPITLPGVVTVTGTGTFTNRATLDTGFDNFAVPLLNQGTLTVSAGATTTFTAPLTNDSTGTVRVNGSNGNSTLLLSKPLVNRGLIELTGSSWAGIIVSSDTVINHGTLHTVSGADNHVIDAVVRHAGEIIVDRNLAITNTGRTFDVSGGSVQVAAGKTLTVNGGIVDIDDVSQLHGTGTLMLGGTLTVNFVGDVTLEPSTLPIVLSGAITLTGTGTLTNQATLNTGTDVFQLPVINEGLLTIDAGATTTFNAPLTNGVGGTLRVNSNNGTSHAQINSRLVNHGLVELTGTSWASIVTASDSVVNEAVGIIHAAAGADNHNINALFMNRGLVDVDRTLSISNSARTFDLRGGMVDVAAGKSLIVNAGTARVDGATQLMGTGALALAGTLTLDLDGDFTLAPATLPLTLPGAVTITGTGTFTNQATLNTGGDVFQLPVINRGLFTVDAGATTTLNAPFDNAAAGTLRINGSNGPSHLQVNSRLMNQGLLELTGSSWTGSIAATDLVNDTGGTVHTVAGADGHTINAVLRNRGLLQVDRNLVVTNTGRTFDMSGGSVQVAAGKTFTVNGGIVDIDDVSQLQGTGSFALAGMLTANFVGDVTLEPSTLPIVLSGTVTLTGTGTLTNQATLNTGADVFQLPVINEGLLTIDVGATTTFNAPLTNAAAGTLRINGNNGTSAVVLSRLVNHGLVELTGSSWASIINATDSVVNETGGSILATGGADGHNINARFTNRGLVDVDRTLSINNNARTFDLRGGTIDVASGKSLIVDHGTVKVDGTTQLQGTGALALAGALTLDLDGDIALESTALPITMPGSVTVAGTGRLTNRASLETGADVFNLPVENEGLITVVLGATTTFNAPVKNSAAGTLRVIGNNGTSHMQVNSRLMNYGLIELTGSSWAGSIAATDSLVNDTGGTVHTVAGPDGHTINAVLRNRGLLRVDRSLAITNTARTFDLRAGSVQVAAGKTLTVNGGTVNINDASQLTGAGTLSLAGTITALLDGDVTLEPATLPILLSGAVTFSGSGALTNQTTLTSRSDVFDVPVVNEGLLTVHQGATTTFNAPLTNAAAGTLRINGNNGPSIVQVNSRLVNEGLLELTGTSWAGVINATDSVVNEMGATLRVAGGADSHVINSVLVNRGLFQVDRSTSVTNTGRTLDARGGTVQVVGGKVLTVNNGTVVIDDAAQLTGTGTLSLAGTVAVNFDGDVTLEPETLPISLTGAVTLTGDGTLTTKSTMNVTGDVFELPVVNDGALNVNGGGTTTFQETVANNGVLAVALGATATFNAPLVNGAAGTLRVNGNNNPSYVQVNSQLVNHGLLELTGTSWSGVVTVADSLVNDTGASLHAATGADSHVINAVVVNRGSLTIDRNLAITNAGRTFDVRGGSVQVVAGKTLTVNGGTVVIDDASQLAGAGTLSLAGTVTAALDGDVTLEATTLPLSLSGAVTVTGSGTLTNQTTLTLTSNTVNVPVVNEGLITVHQGGTATFNAPLTNAAAGTLRINGNNNPSYVQVNSRLMNHGLLELTGTSWAGVINATDSVVNETGASLHVVGGQDSHVINSVLVNRGTFQVDRSTSVTNTGRTLDARGGTVQVAGGKVLTVNNGTVVIDDAAQLTGTGTLSLAGTVAVNFDGDVTLEPETLPISLTGAVTLTGDGTLTTQSTMNVTGDVFELPVVNDGALNVNGGGTTTFQETVANNGVLAVALGATATFNAALVNGAAGTLRVNGNNNPSYVQVNSQLVNHGLIELTGTSWASVVGVTDSLVNQAGATIHAAGGAHAHQINALLHNHGTITADRLITVARASSQHVNTGTIGLAGGSVTFSQSGDAPALENTGTFDIGAGRTLHATAGSLTNVQGGIIRGTGTLRLDGSAISNAGTLSPGGAGIGKLRIQGALENTATAILESDIAGAAAVTEYDVLEVTGAVTLNGDLAIRRAAGYTPAINTNFDVVTALSRAGNFSNVLGTAIDGSFSFQVNYLAAGVRLTVID